MIETKHLFIDSIHDMVDIAFVACGLIHSLFHQLFCFEVEIEVEWSGSDQIRSKRYGISFSFPPSGIWTDNDFTALGLHTPPTFDAIRDGQRHRNSTLSLSLSLSSSLSPSSSSSS